MHGNKVKQNKNRHKYNYRYNAKKKLFITKYPNRNWQMINELDNEPVISKKPIFLAKCINCTVIKLSSSLDIINVVSPFFLPQALIFFVIQVIIKI